MRNVFVILLNMLIFFFLVEAFGGRITILNSNTLFQKVLVGIIFGIFMMLIPNALKFFKLPVNNSSLILMGVIVSFTFFFVSIYILNLINVNPGNVDLGLPFAFVISLQDRTVALVFLSLISAFLSIGLDIMSKSKK